MRINFTDKTLLTYVNKGIDKNTLFTDITGLRVSIRPTSNQQILNNPKLGSMVGIHFKAIFNKDNKRFTFNLGSYPVMTLDEARKQYLDMAVKFKSGKYEEEQEQKLKAITFGELYEEWKAIKFTKISETTQKKYNSVSSQHLRGLFSCPVNKITPNLVIDLLNDYLIKEQKYSTAEYVASLIRAVLDYAVFKQIIVVNPLKGILNFMPRAKTTHYQSFSDATLERDMKGLFKAFSTQDKKLQCLLFMYFFTLLRSNELRTITFDNYSEDSLTVKTKTLDEFRVPLSTQAQKVMQYMIKNHQREDNPYIFEGLSKDGIISKNTLNKALSALGFKDRLRVHGIRTCGRQYMQTIPTAKESIIELCLSHVVGSQVQQAYNRGDYYNERARVMQIWCDFVEKCIGDSFAFITD